MAMGHVILYVIISIACLIAAVHVQESVAEDPIRCIDSLDDMDDISSDVELDLSWDDAHFLL